MDHCASLGTRYGYTSKFYRQKKGGRVSLVSQCILTIAPVKAEELSKARVMSFQGDLAIRLCG